MDAGDTFVYGYPTFYLAIRDCFRRIGGEIHLGHTEKVIKTFLQQNPPSNLIDQEGFTRFFHDLYGNVLQALNYPDDVQEGVAWLWSEWQAGERLRLFDDSLSALKRLSKAGFLLGVISNWDLTFERMLDRLNVRDFFAFTISSIQMGIAKPDPRLFQYALEKTGASANQSWYMGDQIEADIQPAAALGFKTILVDYYDKVCDGHAAHYVAPSMSVAAEIICAAENGNPNVSQSVLER